MNTCIETVDNVLLREFDPPHCCLSSSPLLIAASLRFDFLVVRVDVVSFFLFTFFSLNSLSSSWPLPICLKSLTTCRNPLSNGIFIVHLSFTVPFSASYTFSTLLHTSIVFSLSSSPHSGLCSRPTPTSRYTSGLPYLTFSVRFPLAALVHFMIFLLRISAYLGRGVVVMVI